jgi:hypothetical protein
MEELKAEKKNEGEKPQKPTSMLFNPLGLLGVASMGNLSIASPFYATLANSGASSAGFATSSQSRWNGLGFFGSGQVQGLDLNVGSFTDGYRSTIYGLTVGADYRFTNQLVAGIMANYAYTGGSFTGGGTFSTNSYGGLVFASIQPTDKTFIQVTAGYARNNYLVTRQATATLTAQVDEPPGRCPFFLIAAFRAPRPVIQTATSSMAGYSPATIIRSAALLSDHERVSIIPIPISAHSLKMVRRDLSFGMTRKTFTPFRA